MPLKIPLAAGYKVLATFVSYLRMFDSIVARKISSRRNYIRYACNFIERPDNLRSVEYREPISSFRFNDYEDPLPLDVYWQLNTTKNRIGEVACSTNHGKREKKLEIFCRFEAALLENDYTVSRVARLDPNGEPLRSI